MTVSGSGLDHLAGELAAAWEPQPRVPLLAWIEQHIRLPESISANPGAIQLTDEFAHWREILESCDDPLCREISIMASVQLGKTITALVAVLLGQAATSPSPALFAAPDGNSLHELRERIYAIAAESLAVKDLIPPAHRQNDHWLDFKHARVYLGHSGNKQSLSSKSCRRVYLTEVDRYDARKSNEGDSVDLARARTSAFADWLLIQESTPTLDGESRIQAAYEASDRRTFHVPCPRCGWYQALLFFPHKSGPFLGRGGIQGLRDTRGNYRTPEQARDAAWLQCEQCGGRIEDHERAAMQAAGVWCPRGQAVQDGRLVGTPERGARHRGYWLWSIFAPAKVKPIAELGAGYCAAKAAGLKALQSYTNNTLALAWVDRPEERDWEQTRERLTVPTLPRRRVCSEAIFLTAGVDVQDVLLYWVVRAWGVAGGKPRSWLVDHGKIECDLNPYQEPILDSDLAKLDGVLLTPGWATTDGRALGVQLLAIDSGGHRTGQVYAWQRAHSARARAIKGDAKVAALWELSVLDRSGRDGKPIPGSQELWRLNVSHWKDEIRAAWRLPLADPGAWCLCAGVDEEYLKQITNEIPHPEQRPDGVVFVWTATHPGWGVDYWDAEVYARAAAEMVVGPHAWHALRPQSQSQSPGSCEPSEVPRERPAPREPSEAGPVEQAGPYSYLPAHIQARLRRAAGRPPAPARPGPWTDRPPGPWTS